MFSRHAALAPGAQLEAAGELVDAYGARPRPKGARNDVVVVEQRSEVPVVLTSEISVNAERTSAPFRRAPDAEGPSSDCELPHGSSLLALLAHRNAEQVFRISAR